MSPIGAHGSGSCAGRRRLVRPVVAWLQKIRAKNCRRDRGVCLQIRCASSPRCVAVSRAGCHPPMDLPRRWPHIDFSFSHDPVLLASLGAHGAGDFRTLSAIAPGRQHSAQELRGGAWPCWTAGGQERWLRCRTWSRQEAVSACHGSTAGPDSSRQGTAGHTALRDSVEAPTHHPWPGGGRSGGCWPVVVVLGRA